MAKHIPNFIRDFRCYNLRVRFMASREISLFRSWYYEPRYDLGVALKRSPHYNYLYNTLFSVNSRMVVGKKITPSSPIVIFVPLDKKLYRKGDFVYVSITAIVKDAAIIRDFVRFLPELDNYGFCKRQGLRYDGVEYLEPKSDTFQNVDSATAIAPLDFDYFTKKLIRWKEIIGVNFRTYTSIKINGILTTDIPYHTLINRLSHRLYDLYYNYIYEEKIAKAEDSDIATEPRTENDVEEPLIKEPTQAPIVNKLFLPEKPVIKEGKNYDMAGVKGWIYYQNAYDLLDSYLLTIGQYIHVGTHTVSGNGYYTLEAYNRDTYNDLISRVHNDETFDTDKKEEIIHQLKERCYIPAPYRTVKIYKSDNEYSTLNILDKTDLSLQWHCLKILQKLYKKDFHNNHFIYKKGKGVYQAIKQVLKWKKSLRNDNYTVIRCNIDNFFDSINHAILYSELTEKSGDPFMAFLIELWIKPAIIDSDEEHRKSYTGLPQGAAISPFLSDVYLNKLDDIIEDSITRYFIRYADDILLIVLEPQDPISALQKLSSYLYRKFRLRLSKEFYVGSFADPFEFLGIRFGEDKLRLADVKKAKISLKISRSLVLDDSHFSKFEETIKGIKKYYGRLLDKDEMKLIYSNIDLGIADFFKGKNYKKVKSKINDIAEIHTAINRKTIKKTLKNSTEHKTKKEKKQKKRLSINEKSEKQKLGYLESKSNSTELKVTESGAFVGTSRNKIRVSKGGKTLITRKVSEIKQISLMNKGIGISSNLTKICRRNDISIVYYNENGEE